MATNEIATMLRPGGKSDPLRSFIVQVPDLFALVDRCIENDVRIPMLCRPNNRFTTDHTRNPHARMRLLQWQHPRVNHAELIMIAFPAERPRLGPRLNNDVVSFVEAFAVECGIGIG